MNPLDIDYHKQLTSRFYNLFSTPVFATEDEDVAINCLKILGNEFCLQQINKLSCTPFDSIYQINFVLTQEINECWIKYNLDRNDSKFEHTFGNMLHDVRSKFDSATATCITVSKVFTIIKDNEKNKQKLDIEKRVEIEEAFKAKYNQYRYR